MENKNKKSFIKGALCGALAVLLVAGLVSCGMVSRNKSILTKDVQKKMNVLQSYVDSAYLHKIDQEKATEGLYKGYIAGLDDPYSQYYDKEETKKLNESTSGEYSGIGAVMTQDQETGIITITKVYPDSPSDKAGIKDNDILYTVDGKTVTDQSLSDVVNDIRGEKGTKVEIEVLRGNDKEVIKMSVTRDKVKVRTVESKMLADKVGYISVSEFESVTYQQYVDALDELTGEGMKGLVVDLRNNPGGNLSTVCDMLDEMLPSGLLVYTEDKNGKKMEMTSDDERQFKLPLVVLVNGNSASASEIFAGAIQDYGTGKIVGTQTFGKGVVQQIYDLKDGTSLKLTVAQYFTPKGRNIDGKGITPDVKVEYKADEKNKDADNQLEKAIEVLKKEGM